MEMKCYEDLDCCPFCGSLEMITDYFEDDYIVYCRHCDRNIPTDDPRKETECQLPTPNLQKAK